MFIINNSIQSGISTSMIPAISRTLAYKSTPSSYLTVLKPALCAYNATLVFRPSAIRPKHPLGVRLRCHILWHDIEFR